MAYGSAGLYFDQFNIGDEFIGKSRTVTETDVVSFAGLSGDYNPLHTDEEFAKKTPFGGRIAHGMLVLALFSGSLGMLGILEGTALAFMGLSWRFIDAVKFGDTITCSMKVREKKAPKENRGIVIFDAKVKNQRGEVVQEGDLTVLVARKK